MFAIECESADDEDVWGCLHLANHMLKEIASHRYSHMYMCEPNLELLRVGWSRILWAGRRNFDRWCYHSELWWT